MNTSPWYVDIDFTVSEELADGVEFGVLEALEPYAAAMSTNRDRRGGGVSFTVEAESVTATVPEIQKAVDSIRHILGGLHIIHVDVRTEEAIKASNATLSIPDLVGYSEIAELAGVSRQRAREIAHLEGFPVPVVETAAGPLRVKEAVESWLKSWDRKPGRPRKLATA